MSIVFEKISRNICSILINRPSKRNALNLNLIKQLRNALDNFEQDDQFSVAILSGVGGNFCAGYDLGTVIDPKTGMPNLQMIEQMLWPVGTYLSDKKTVVAAIEGHAAGFGYELAMKCDFRIGERDSRLGFLNRRFGFPIINGGTVMLPQLIGQARALELVATGKAQLAPEALSFGALNYIADIGCSMGRALNLARSLCKFDQVALAHDIAHIKQANRKTVEDMLKKERKDSLEYLKKCGPMDVAVKFLEGKLCRHGSTDLGNLLDPSPELTL